MHLNIRSLRNKVSEVRAIVYQHKPHIFGLSECELKKKDYFDEDSLKISGYDIIYPKSWDLYGIARVLTYVKSSLDYERVLELEHDSFQSIWLKGGFKNSKKILFCHAYREHTSTLGNSLRSQRKSLEIFVAQWEKASDLKIGGESSEIHVAGDMNLDSLDGRWFSQTYHLHSLAKVLHEACNIIGMSQLVKLPTRFQYNSVAGTTSISCIDHVYSNNRFRCSDVSIIPFGNSDHNMISFVRYSKEPPAVARTICRRSYKNFVPDDFLAQLSCIDWSPVYYSQDVDEAVDNFTRNFKNILDQHAPLITFQQRKRYTPWVTPDTIELMKKRDLAKSKASEIAKTGGDSSSAWADFKKIRNRINNRLRFEENKYKQEKNNESPSSPAHCWNTAKCFMNWRSEAGPPSQLLVNGNLITKASSIASEMNKYFLDKVDLIRNDIKILPNNFPNVTTS